MTPLRIALLAIAVSVLGYVFWLALAKLFTGRAAKETESRPLVGASCKTWTPCRVTPDPAECCKSKPPGCDSWCDESKELQSVVEKQN